MNDTPSNPATDISFNLYYVVVVKVATYFIQWMRDFSIKTCVKWDLGSDVYWNSKWRSNKPFQYTLNNSLQPNYPFLAFAVITLYIFASFLTFLADQSTGRFFRPMTRISNVKWWKKHWLKEKKRAQRHKLLTCPLLPLLLSLLKTKRDNPQKTIEVHILTFTSSS